MKICLIGKIPPVQGGTPKETLYTAYHLAKSGHEVHVITNSLEVEHEYRIETLNYFSEIDPCFSDEIKKLPLYIHATHREMRHSYIPRGNPIVTKLASMAMKVIKENQIDIIYAVYFEPYAMVASLVSSWTKIPYVVRHAGSDIDRLLGCASLEDSYQYMLKNAACIITNQSHLSTYLRLGVGVEKLFYRIPIADLPDSIHSTKPLDVNNYLQYVRKSDCGYIRAHYADFETHHFDPNLTTIAIFGKTNPFKGHLDLVRALGVLKQRGVKFNLLGLIQGPSHELKNLIEELKKHDILDNTFLLPYIPHWHMKAFYDQCQIVCFLERDFPVACHMPSIPTEVFSVGKCLITSEEIYAKIATRVPNLQRDTNVLVTDPKDIVSLSKTLDYAIQNPKKVIEIGKNAKELLAERHQRSDLSDIFTQIYEKSLINERFERNDKPDKSTYVSAYAARLSIVFHRSVQLLRDNLTTKFHEYLESTYPRKLENSELVEGFHKYILDTVKDEFEREYIIENIRFDYVYFDVVLSKPPAGESSLVHEDIFHDYIPQSHPEGHFESFKIKPNRSKRGDFSVNLYDPQVYFLRPRASHHESSIFEIDDDLAEFIKDINGKKTVACLTKGNTDMVRTLYELYKNRVIV